MVPSPSVPSVSQDPTPPAAARIPWAAILWLGLLLLILFMPVLKTMVKEWAQDESMGHGFFVPLVSGYIIWQRRDQILQTPLKPNWIGYVLMVWGFCQLIVGTLGADFFMMRTAFLISLLGVILATCGFPVVKVLAFPLFLLLFMIRIPLFIYSQITFPLQLFASGVAEFVLDALGIAVYRQGNVLELANQKLNVVEACSGIRSLLSLGFLSLVYGCFFEKKTWIRVVLFLSTIPIAIAANAMRVSITGIISEYKQEFARGFYHSFEGWVIFIVALVCLLLVHRLLLLFTATYSIKGASHAEVS
jgi:exosortase